VLTLTVRTERCTMKREQRMNIPEQVLDLIRAHCPSEQPPGLRALADAARAQHGASARAVLFYGSCLRTGNIHDGLVDLYLLVDDYRAAYKSRILAFLNRLLPPNVFYLEVPYQGHTLRAKYAVLTLADLRRGTERWFHSYLWGRFCQKSGLVYVQDDQYARQVQEAFGAAVMTFVARTLPRMDASFDARDMWTRGLSLSYRSELRTEQPDGAARLFDADPEYYRALTRAALAGAPFAGMVRPDTMPDRYQVRMPRNARRLNSAAWRLRALQGKVLSVLRLLKASMTFTNGVNYILWKIERHSGVRVEVSEKLRRVPLLAVIVIFWRLYRRDAFR
jgi:hypothetical protein